MTQPKELQKKILIVDDETELCDLVVEELQFMGHQAVGVYTLSAAIKVLECEAIGLIISDVTMPDGGGLVLCDLIQKSGLPPTPVVLVTGIAEVSAEKIGNRPITAVLGKPIDFNKLNSIIREKMSANEHKLHE